MRPTMTEHRIRDGRSQITVTGGAIPCEMLVFNFTEFGMGVDIVNNATIVGSESVSYEDISKAAMDRVAMIDMLKALSRVFNDRNFTDRAGYGERIDALIKRVEGRK